MLIELSIKREYRPNWEGKWHGIRELIQNCIDAEKEFSALSSIKYKKDRLIIKNTGCSIEHKCLLLGETSKTGKDELIGKWGDGLKIGFLSLVRDNIKVRLTTGDEIWTPVLYQSKKFNEEVLAIDIKKRKTTSNEVTVEVWITEKQWKDIKNRFLFLKEPKEKYTVSRGSIILDPEYGGKLYVKGIFIEKDEKFKYGYDLTFARLDVDRQMIQSFDKTWESSYLFAQAAEVYSEKLFDRFYISLEEGAKDIEEVSNSAGGYFSSNTSQKCLNRFRDTYGKDSYPVNNLEESRILSNRGKIGIITSEPLNFAISKTIGSFRDLLEKFKLTPTKVWAWHELESAQEYNLVTVVDLINKYTQYPINIADLKIVSFEEDNILGCHRNNQIEISIKALDKLQKAVSVISHELAHKISQAADGERLHSQATEDILSSIAIGLFEKREIINEN